MRNPRAHTENANTRSCLVKTRKSALFRSFPWQTYLPERESKLLLKDAVRSLGGRALSVSSPRTQSKAIPLLVILLIAAAVHGPLLFMQLPNNSYDTNFHKFFAVHYAQHWFNPWNEKWFTGFNQATYPPLQHQWIALFSKVLNLDYAYMMVQLIAILLLPVGMYRFAKIWVDDRSASYAALFSVFLGSLSFLVYQSGQLSTTTAAPLYLNALPYFYEWSRQAKFRALIKGAVLCFAAAAAHHVTLLFGAVLFAIPVLWTAILDRHRGGNQSSAIAVLARSIVFGAVVAVGAGLVLLPYFIALVKYPITQMPIPHASRANFLLEPIWGVNFFVVPLGALLLALPWIFWKGLSERRFRPLFFGFWFAMLFGLGSTTPVPRMLLGRAFDVLTFERFNYWATLLALPIVAAGATVLIDRFGRRAVVGLSSAAIASCAFALGWLVLHPINTKPFDVAPVVEFLNRDGHDRFRYLTLGFGSKMSEVGYKSKASSVDGEYNSARALPEMTKYGAAQLSNSKYYGTAGMESLRAMLKHANIYGLKYVFVRDPYYEPLLAFTGWRKTEVYDSGGITLWTKDDVPPARQMEYGDRPPAWHGVLWGILPIGSSILAIFVVLALPDRRRFAEPITFPEPAEQPVVLREAK